MRVVLDVNVIISALLSPRGAPATVVRAWIDGAFELVVSPRLLAELRRALAYPKLSARISPDLADEVVELLRRTAIMIEDPAGPPPMRSQDPDDDYLITLAQTAQALIVSGDRHLLDVPGLPVRTPAALLAELR